MGGKNSKDYICEYQNDSSMINRQLAGIISIDRERVQKILNALRENGKVLTKEHLVYRRTIYISPTIVKIPTKLIKNLTIKHPLSTTSIERVAELFLMTAKHKTKGYMHVIKLLPGVKILNTQDPEIVNHCRKYYENIQSGLGEKYVLASSTEQELIVLPECNMKLTSRKGKRLYWEISVEKQ
jgi:hypothetical protein